ncbi:MAG TPA: hypothetical protein VGT05_01030 [Patescibacteria group bacterium]|nr:hypothetical protein [Patescibacteria group bacterium]
MKKILFLFALLSTGFLLLQHAVRAATAVTPTTDISQQQIYQELQSKIASQVAKMHLTEKKGVIGMVNDVNESQITLSDNKGNIRFIDVDELTKFASPSATSFGLSDITKGSTIGVLGLYNKESRRILARFVDGLIQSLSFNGIVVGIDRTNYNIKVETNDNNEVTIEIEDTTKTASYTSDGGLVKSGFSKVNTGERITVTGYDNNASKDDIIASRLLIFPNLPANPAIDAKKFGSFDQTQITPSTGSGVKLVPIVK